jgi:hypothetical protein
MATGHDPVGALLAAPRFTDRRAVARESAQGFNQAHVSALDVISKGSSIIS